MKIIAKLQNALIFTGVVALTWHFMANYPFAFNFIPANSGQYFAVLAAVCCWTILLFMHLVSGKRPGSLQWVAMVCASALMLCLLFSRYYSTGNEYFANITSFVLLFSILLSARPRLLQSLLVFLAAVFFWQLYLAFRQMNWFAFNVNGLNVQGTLQNAGIFSCYIVCQLPFVYYLFFDAPASPGQGMRLIPAWALPVFKVTKVIVFSLMAGLVAFIVWRSQSRTALIALCALIVSFFMQHFRTEVKAFISRWPKLLSLGFAGVLFLGAGYAAWRLFCLKKLSAIGRMMTLDISTDHLFEHFWLGTGVGRFTWYYPQWQAQYFALHPAPSKDYFLAAGESYILFNEYVQLFQTAGLVGFSVFVLMLLWFFTAGTAEYTALLNAARLTVIAILIFGVTSYPFHVNILLLLLVMCFAIVVNVRNNKWPALDKALAAIRLPTVWTRLATVGAIGIAGIACVTVFHAWEAKLRWDELSKRLDDTRAETKAVYEKIGVLLNNDGRFMTDYGIFLLEDSADCRQACVILEKAKKLFISRSTIETLAEAYSKQGNDKKSIENYEWLCQYLPNKFRPRLHLLSLYNRTGDTVDAKKLAHAILAMPVKIPSLDVDNVKLEAEAVLSGMR
jgi:hypothetical protein